MLIGRGRIRELRLDSLGQTQAWIECPDSLTPNPGQYLLARAIEEDASPLATPLFPSELPGMGFWTATPIPYYWLPGTQLELRGVLGHGFTGFSGARRVALISISSTPACLLPLVSVTCKLGASVTLFANQTPSDLPACLEIYPLASFPHLLNWPDYLALDLPIDELPRLRTILGLHPHQLIPCPAQALISTPMPCGGLADCGACAVPTRRGWKLACTDGPVFDLRTIEF